MDVKCTQTTYIKIEGRERQNRIDSDGCVWCPKYIYRKIYKETSSVCSAANDREESHLISSAVWSRFGRHHSQHQTSSFSNPPFALFFPPAGETIQPSSFIPNCCLKSIHHFIYIYKKGIKCRPTDISIQPTNIEYIYNSQLVTLNTDIYIYI